MSNTNSITTTKKLIETIWLTKAFSIQLGCEQHYATLYNRRLGSVLTFHDFMTSAVRQDYIDLLKDMLLTSNGDYRSSVPMELVLAMARSGVNPLRIALCLANC